MKQICGLYDNCKDREECEDGFVRQKVNKGRGGKIQCGNYDPRPAWMIKDNMPKHTIKELIEQ